MKTQQIIKILADLEIDFTTWAEKCSKARRLLEKAEGPSSAPRKGGAVDHAVVRSIINQRNRTMVRRAK